MKKNSKELTPEDRKEVTNMAARGMTIEEVAFVKGWEYQFVWRHLKMEMQRGRAIGKGTIKETAFRMANSGKFPAMTIFWLKANCGWRDVHPEDEYKAKESLSLKKMGVTDAVEAATIYQKIMKGDS